MWYAILYIFCVLEFSVSLWGWEGDLSLLPTEFISFYCRGLPDKPRVSMAAHSFCNRIINYF